MTYDLIVVGAGPGGCATAITAARLGANVLLIERGHFPRHKVCGEFVSAESLGVLASLLTLERRSLIANAPPIAYCRIFAEGTEIRAGISPVAASIARFDLDEALWQSALGSRVHVQPGCTVQEVQRVSRPDSYQPAFRVVTAAREFRARAVVNASGRWSSLTTAARRSGITGARWIGLKAHFREPAASASVDLYFFEGGYCGVQPVSPAGRNGSGSVVNACAMVKAEIARDMPQVLLCHSRLEQRSRSWEPLMEPVTTSPLIFHEPEPVQDGMLQVGDAATFVDPFVGDGISLALRSGALAGECLAGFIAQACSLDEALTRYSKTYRKRLVPVFRASSRLRKLMDWPPLVRRPVLSLLERSPLLTRQLVRRTR